MSDNVSSIRLAQAVGITSSAFAGGAVAGISYFMVPELLKSPTPLLLKQWANCYNTGKKTIPPVAAIASACFFYLATKTPITTAKVKFYKYVVAGLLGVGIVPYTIGFMGKTNRKLHGKAEQTKSFNVTDEFVEAGVQQETAHWLIDHWAILNLGRAVLLLASAGLGAWTALE